MKKSPFVIYASLKIMLLGTIVFFGACENGKEGKVLSTPTSGSVNASSDETLSFLISTQVDTFNALYPKAHIGISYKPQTDVFKDLVNDSVDVAIVTRTLNKKEKAYFDSKKLFPKVTKIAIDAIALIISPDNTDSLLTLQQLKDILSGKITSWNQLNPKSSLSAIQIVFDNNSSSTVSYLKDSVNAGKALPANCFATKSNDEVIEYVNKHKNSIGVIGVSWISDRDDPKTTSFLKKIRVMSISGNQNTEEYYKPYQAYLHQGVYPLCRYIYIINREGRNGLGTGFVSFVAGDKGQRIILKAGLVPATMPVRVVGFGNE